MMIHDTKRCMETDAYHDLGFYIVSGTLIETGRGYKNEERDPTDIEEDLFLRYVDQTPEIKTIFIDDGDADNYETVINIEGIKDYKCFWVASKEDYKTWKRSVLWMWRPDYGKESKTLVIKDHWFDV